MKLEKKISLHSFEVEYIDQREAKPRTLHRESIVLDGGRMNTLDHLNQTPQSWIRQQYAQQGYTVAAIHKGESLTAKVDTGFLWKLAALDAAAAKAGKSVAKLLTAAQWQEVLCRVRSLSAADKDRLLTYLHALHDKPQQLMNTESTPETQPHTASESAA